MHDAFGRRITCNIARLRFLAPEPEPGQGGGGGSEDLGFPKDTPVAEMDDKQAAAYWRNQSKLQQQRAKDAEGRAQSDDDRDAAAKWRQHQQDSQSDTDRKIQEARDEARREGENLGSQRYLADAVKATFQRITGKSDDEVATAFEVIDITKFVGQTGDIDTQKLNDFAATFGPSGAGDRQQQTTTDPVKAALERQRSGGSGGGNGDGSVATIRQLRREQLMGTGKQ